MAKDDVLTWKNEKITTCNASLLFQKDVKACCPRIQYKTVIYPKILLSFKRFLFVLINILFQKLFKTSLTLLCKKVKDLIKFI